MCPLKDPTYIINKNIRENIIQHNNLYGKVNKQYHKDTDLPTTQARPTRATIQTIANSAHTSSTIPSPAITDFFDPYAPSAPPLEDLHLQYDLPTPPLETESSSEIIQTEAFDIPIPLSANFCATSLTDTSTASPFVDLIFDPTSFQLLTHGGTTIILHPRKYFYRT
jgi:hypothetical protein